MLDNAEFERLESEIINHTALAELMRRIIESTSMFMRDINEWKSGKILFKQDQGLALVAITHDQGAMSFMALKKNVYAYNVCRTHAMFYSAVAKDCGSDGDCGKQQLVFDAAFAQIQENHNQLILAYEVPGLAAYTWITEFGRGECYRANNGDIRFSLSQSVSLDRISALYRILNDLHLIELYGVHSGIEPHQFDFASLVGTKPVESNNV